MFVVEQTSQKVQKLKGKNKRPIGVTKMGNRDEKTGPKLRGCFDPTKIAPCMARLGIFLGTFSPNLHQNAHFCTPGKALLIIYLTSTERPSKRFLMTETQFTGC